VRNDGTVIVPQSIAYWILAGLLAIMYLYSGGLKLVRSKDALRPMMGWVDDMPLAAVKTIGALEVLAAAGLILPPLTGVLPWLAIVAASGLVLLQIAAIIVHVRRGDRQIWLNAVLLAAAAVAIWLATVWL
jgi:uncharacterized membrane protein